MSYADCGSKDAIGMIGMRCLDTCICLTISITCAGPESFFRGVPTLTTLKKKILFDEEIQIPLKAGHHRPASETPVKWRFAGVTMMVQH